MGMLRTPRLFMVPKAIPTVASRVSGERAAGVVDHVMRAQTSWEPAKLWGVLRSVAGGGVGQGRTGGHALCASGWRIGA